MRRVTLLLFMTLHAIYFVGAVCGSNPSTAKSMECCQHGSMKGMQNQHMDACCKHCDMGKKKSIAKFQRALLKDYIRIPISIDNIWNMNLSHLQEFNRTNLIHSCSFTAHSPPTFITHKQLLI